MQNTTICKEEREEKEVLEEKEEDEEKGLYKSYQSKNSFSWRNLGIPASSTYLFIGKFIVVLK